MVMNCFVLPLVLTQPHPPGGECEECREDGGGDLCSEVWSGWHHVPHGDWKSVQLRKVSCSNASYSWLAGVSSVASE